MRGEQRGAKSASLMRDGSSPTCVGNRAYFRKGILDGPVHPHMRGEQTESCGTDRRRRGSSPHAWGTVPALLDPDIDRRFIPTCVGNSDCPILEEEAWTVHPHMRGEQENTGLRMSATDGSSPHAWGTEI